MEKITEKIADLPPNASYFSLEFFPPKTEIGLQNLRARLHRMSRALRPLFINVTWGAGGSTAARSLELAEICQRQLGLTTCLHLTCTNMSKGTLDEALKEARELGVRNILALRGDPPRNEEYALEGQEPQSLGELVWAADLVRYIRREHGGYFCIGVAGYPEGHSHISYPTDQDPRRDMPHLVEKVQAGADFIMTQLFYDVDAYLAYEKLVREWDGGVLKDVIIIPGLMPVQSYQVLKRTTFLSHAKVPPDLMQRLAEVKGDDEAVKRVGVDYLTSIIRSIKSTPSALRRGYHFYTLNLEKAVSFVLERSHLIPPITPDIEYSSAIDDSESLTNGTSESLTNGTSHSPVSTIINPSRRRQSSAHNTINTDSDRAPSSLEPPSRATTLAIAQGIGSLGREATWDDYPNGRFGDARSPAFGEIDGYGTSLHLSPASARLKWGHPRSRADISALFLAHLRVTLDQLPWSEGSLSEETLLIQAELCALIERRGWWSVASQPAVDAARSSDPVFGWGPRGGFVFQKAFVEFWIPAEDWVNVLRPHLEKAEVAEEVSWYASPCPAAIATRESNTGSNTSSNTVQDQDSDRTEPLPPSLSSPSSPHPSSPPSPQSSLPSSAANSVTWGSFPGKEIVTPTIIEEISFRAWADEAFAIWAEWEACYAPGSESRRLLRRCRRDLWLVNVIGHRYREPGRLWEILMQA